MSGIGIRAATERDCALIARAIDISSGGYARIGWLRAAADFPGLSPVEIGARHYARNQPPFCWSNCVVAEADEPRGIMLTYAVDDGGGSAEPDDTGEPDLYYPVRMEVPGSWYICGMTVFEPWRGQGIGTRFLGTAREQAAVRGLSCLSLIAFAENAGSVKLYLRNGFRVIERRRLIPHPLIAYRGDALLMRADI